MATTPKIDDIDPKCFECDNDNDFTIIGTGFAKHVTVKLEETKYLMDHEWKPPEQDFESDASSESVADGTHILVRSRPRKKDGSKCDPKDTYPLGDLTITVTNNDFGKTATGSDKQSFDVTYYS